MSITRRSLFGIPPNPTQGSTNTTRLVPLTQGVHPDQPWPLLPPGSSISCSNFLPLDGVLVPRSRLSSLNTLRTVDAALGMAVLRPTSATAATLWYSASTMHGMIFSGGSVSRASFVSSFGLGVAGIQSASHWEYAQVFLANINQNGLVAAGGSNSTLLLLYQAGGVSSGAPLYSYLTSAPPANAVVVFDSYVVAFNTAAGATRVQWCVRGTPSNWTGEGSGFEDLLDMRGSGIAMRGFSDDRFLLFSDREIWYGVSATYPAQFRFFPLDRQVGCMHPGTIAETEQGLLFLGSDTALRFIPYGGGASQVVVPTLAKALRFMTTDGGPGLTWALYDPTTKLYYLHVDFGGTRRGFVVNTLTQEWVYWDPNDTALRSGAALRGATSFPTTWHEGIFFGNSNGTIYSTSSLIANENGSAVTAFFRSAPIAPELAGNYKQLTKVCVDYRATSTSTLTLKLSQDGGNTYEATGRLVSLPVAVNSGRAESDVYAGGAFPTIEIKSESTGFELHRLDVSMQIGGRK